MRLIQATLCFVLVMLASSAMAQTSSTMQSLAGNWTSETADGVFTQLEVSTGGKFVLREQHSRDPRRAYLCGHLTDRGSTLALDVKGMKERLINGDIEQNVGEQTITLDVIRRTDRTLIVTYDQRTIVLNLI